MEALLEVEARRVQILEERPEAARRAVTALCFVNGMLLATWVSRIPAIERLRGLNHATFGLALLIVAAGAVISMPIAGSISARIGTGRICQFSALTYILALPLLALVPNPATWGLALFVFGAGHDGGRRYGRLERGVFEANDGHKRRPCSDRLRCFFQSPWQRDVSPVIGFRHISGP
jgi:Major Facilitator Superfamily